MKIDARVFYPNSKSPGIVCEVIGGMVFEAGEPHARPLRDYTYGRFVRLVEVEETPADGEPNQSA